MANPNQISIPEWTYVKFAENIKSVELYLAEAKVYYYYTYRQHNEAAPTNPTVGLIPTDAKKIFEDGNSYTVKSSEAIDVYVFAANTDDDSADDGKILVGNVQNSVDVEQQDQTTPMIIMKFNQIIDSITLAVEASKYDKTITVSDATNIIDGSYIILFQPTTRRFYTGYAVGAPAGAVVTLDTPLDADFAVGTNIDVSKTNMAVNGATTPQIFGVRGTTAIPGVNVTGDFTRIIITCIATSAVDLTKFANLGVLTNGLVLRRVDGTTHNIFNVKSNQELAGIMYDWTVVEASNPQQGVDGFIGRFTFARLGTVSRLALGEDLQLIVQDNLSTITSLEVVIEGHLTD